MISGKCGLVKEDKEAPEKLAYGKITEWTKQNMVV